MNVKLRKLIFHMSKYATYVAMFCYSLTMAFGTESAAQQKLLADISVDLKYQNTNLIQLIRELEGSTGFSFVYSKKELRDRPVTIPDGKWKLDELMYSVSLQANVAIRRVNQQISVKPVDSHINAPSVEERIEPPHDVSGKVTDEEGQPLAGVTVVLQGTSTGTVTNLAGEYSLSLPDENSVLLFSFIGYLTQEISVASRSTIDVAMAPDVLSLQEVLVTALGVEKESKKLGYAATSVNTEDMVKNRTTNVMESLEGKVAGLNITPPSAGAGSSMQIRLRGQAAFAGASNSPLFVINGLPIDQDARGANGRDSQRDLGDNLQNINPDDIESMTVLKGATAAAIYGARAANGAIIITTKSGKKNQGLGVEFTSSFTTMHALNFMDEITQTEYGQGTGGQRPQTQGEAQATGQFGFGERLDGQPTINFDGVMRPYSAYPYKLYDFLQTGTNLTNTIGLSGGSEKGSFRVSFSNTEAKGIQPANTYKKWIFNVGINHDITEKLKLQMNVNFADEENINPPQIGTQGPGAVNFFNRIAVSTPIEAFESGAIDPATNAEIRTNGFLGTINNPYYQLQKGQFFNDDRKRLLGTATLRYQLTDWLYLQGRYNYDYGTNFMEWNDLNGAGATNVFSGNTGYYRGRYDIQQDQSTDVNADFLIGGNKDFDKFSVDASFGGNTWRTRWQRNAQYSRLFVAPDLYSIGNGTSFGTDDADFNPYQLRESRINSLYGWAEIGYNGIVYVNFTGRKDWFSVLNPDDNSKFYPSVSGSLIFSELLGNQNWLDYGKFRASWAEVGSANGVNPYEGVLTYSINPAFNGQTTAEINGTLAPNPQLRPFTVEEQEIGVELRMLNGKVLIDLAAFKKVTTDQILEVSISDGSGYQNFKENAASLRNSGVESFIQATPFETNDFSWTTSWNNAFLDTEVLDVGNESGSLLLIYFNGTGNEFLGELRYTEGLAMNQLYTRTYRRNDQGQIVVNDAGRLLATNGETPGAEDTNGFLPVGSSIPKHVGGWTNNFTFKNLSLGIHIDYKFGGTVLSSTHLNMLRQGHSKLSLEGRREGEEGLVFPAVYESNGQPNTTAVTNLQSFYADYRNLQIGDPLTFKSDFIKLRSISLAYDFSRLVSRAPALKFVKGLSVSAAVRNVAILYKDLPGLDPEAIQSSGDFRAGYENSALPTTRNYNISLNVKF